MNGGIKRLITSAIVLAALTLAGTTHARSLVCESRDRDTRYCPADTSDGVRLSVQYSQSSCRQGSTWGYDSDGIWVSNGCRAQFDIGEHNSNHQSNADSKAAAALAIGLIGAVAIVSHHNRNDSNDRDDRHGRDYDYQPYDHHGYYGASDHVTCESRNSGYNFCRANLRHARVDIERQISHTTCRHGKNWDWSSSGIWVDDGCAAVFSIY
jgi:hypothetical protein